MEKDSMTDTERAREILRQCWHNAQPRAYEWKTRDDWENECAELVVHALAQARREGMETAATRVCEWIDGADAYETACGHAYWLACGTLTECEHRYCPWCGGRIAPQEEG